jgi:exoenzyme U
MPPPGPTAEMDAWLRDMFGVDPQAYQPSALRGAAPPSRDQKGVTPGGKKIGVGSKTPGIPAAAFTRAVGPALLKDGPGKPGARIAAPLPAGPPTVCRAPDGKEISIARAPDGRVSMTRDPPPVTEITFSGGGGKGVALPGAVWALAQTGVLASAQEMRGASVGSMTAATLAAGMTPQDFQALSDDIDFDKLVHADHAGPILHDGMAVEALVRDKMKSALNKQIAAFAQNAMARGITIDPVNQEMLTAMSKKFATGAGPTFGDLRTLSRLIPGIKELVISGTQIGEAPVAGPGQKQADAKDVKPTLRLFSADTEPDMDVAAAVHASCALPPVFKPVDLKLSNGTIGRFEDGGVLNNAPSSDTTGTDRAVDPVPDQSKMTFIFEGDAAHDVMAGKVKPSWQPINDILSRAPNSAADYAKDRTLAERPEDVVMVPLKFQRTNGKEADFSGTFSGTVNFDIKKEDRIRLQGLTEAQTRAYVEKSRQKETRVFDSDTQMLNCIPREELATLADSKIPGALETLVFRDEVVKDVDLLEAWAATGVGAGDPEIQRILKTIDALAENDRERLGFIGRTLNRSGRLDTLLEGARAAAGGASTGLEALDAGVAVNEVVAVRALAKKILEQSVYPKMVKPWNDGVEGRLLAQMEAILRAAKTRRNINRALTIGIDYYHDKFDMLGALGNEKFAEELRAYLQPAH